jgi:Methyltransferase domain
MYLPWHWANPAIDRHNVVTQTWTSLTRGETEKLRDLATGQVCLEIGAAFGYSTAVIASTAKHLWSIDPHNVTPGGVLAYYNFMAGVPEGFESTAVALEKLLAELGLKERVTPCLGYSQDLIWPPGGELLPDLVSPPVTFCFIDGDHGRTACFGDLMACLALPLPPGAERTIAVHDFGEDTNPDVAEVVMDWLGSYNEPPCALELVDTLAVLIVRAPT